MPRLLSPIPAAGWSLVAAAVCAVVFGCKAVAPSHDRKWEPDQQRMPLAVLDGDQAAVRNIRRCAYLTKDKFAVDYYEKTFDLNRLETVDFIVVPFRDSPTLAHTMLSFGFGGEDYLALSVEVRREKGEAYNPIYGAARQYELMYVLGDERDLIGLRAVHRGDEVYLYRTRATPSQARALLVDVLKRVNQLHAEPEFYDTISNNCTTNLVRHINQLSPDKVPIDDPRILLSGFSDELAYDLGLLQSSGTFEETRPRARIDELARRYAERPDFSQRIRR